jgi:hypothetical protein
MSIGEFLFSGADNFTLPHGSVSSSARTEEETGLEDEDDLEEDTASLGEEGTASLEEIASLKEEISLEIPIDDSIEDGTISEETLIGCSLAQEIKPKAMRARINGVFFIARIIVFWMASKQRLNLLCITNLIME